MKNIAIIPARSGSKRFPDKNINLLRGKPLLVYSIEAAQKSKLFEVIHLSTDSEEYAQIGRQAGLNIPFLREKIFAQDETTTYETIKNDLKKYRDKGQIFDNVMILQPTSPLRTEQDIINAYQLFTEKKAKGVVSVCKCDHPPFWSNILSEKRTMEYFEVSDEVRIKQRSQSFYRLNGAIYLYDVNHFMKEGMIYDMDTYAYIMDKSHSIDIDNEIDFELAGLYLGRMDKYAEYRVKQMENVTCR